MNQNYPFLHADELATKARATLRSRGLRVLPVVDERKHIIGVKKGRFRAPSKISSMMKTLVISLKSTSTVREAAEPMLKKNFGRVPVVDEKGRLIGIVDREDVARALL